MEQWLSHVLKAAHVAPFENDPAPLGLDDHWGRTSFDKMATNKKTAEAEEHVRQAEKWYENNGLSITSRTKTDTKQNCTYSV